MELSSIAGIIAWPGGTMFTYLYIVAVGHLRDDGKTWFEGIFKNQMLIFGFMGILTLLSLLTY